MPTQTRFLLVTPLNSVRPQSHEFTDHLCDFHRLFCTNSLYKFLSPNSAPFNFSRCLKSRIIWTLLLVITPLLSISWYPVWIWLTYTRLSHPHWSLSSQYGPRDFPGTRPYDDARQAFQLNLTSAIRTFGSFKHGLTRSARPKISLKKCRFDLKPKSCAYPVTLQVPSMGAPTYSIFMIVFCFLLSSALCVPLVGG